MSKLPAITARKAIAAFGKAGFVVDRISGSHKILVKQGHRYHLSVPDHGGKTLPGPLVQNLIKAAGLTQEEFRALL